MYLGLPALVQITVLAYLFSPVYCLGNSRLNEMVSVLLRDQIFICKIFFTLLLFSVFCSAFLLVSLIQGGEAD